MDDALPPVITCPRCRQDQLRMDGENKVALKCGLCGHQSPVDNRIVELQSPSSDDAMWAEYHARQRRTLITRSAKGNRAYPRYRHLFRPLMGSLHGSMVLDLGCGIGQAVFGPQHPA